MTSNGAGTALRRRGRALAGRAVMATQRAASSCSDRRQAALRRACGHTTGEPQRGGALPRGPRSVVVLLGALVLWQRLPVRLTVVRERAHRQLALQAAVRKHRPDLGVTRAIAAEGDLAPVGGPTRVPALFRRQPGLVAAVGAHREDVETALDSASGEIAVVRDLAAVRRPVRPLLVEFAERELTHVAAVRVHRED